MSSPRYWAVVPAAGSGRRVGGSVPKQYLALGGRPVIAHALARISTHPSVAGVVVAVAAEDSWWAGVADGLACAPVCVAGGRERCHSVLNALAHLRGCAHPRDWVLVHDAVRPCLRGGDLARLIDEASGHAVGGVLGARVRDTMKRARADGDIIDTLDRDGLWHAFTPQMFRLEALAAALAGAVDGGRTVTDEAQAMELAGASPCLVEGHSDNIKITTRADLALAEHYLRAQEQEQ